MLPRGDPAGGGGAGVPPLLRAHLPRHEGAPRHRLHHRGAQAAALPRPALPAAADAVGVAGGRGGGHGGAPVQLHPHLRPRAPRQHTGHHARWGRTRYFQRIFLSAKQTCKS